MLSVTFLQGGRVWEKNEWFLMGSIDPLRGSFIYNPIPLGHNDTSTAANSAVKAKYQIDLYRLRLVERIMPPSRSADWSTESCRSRGLQIGIRIILPSRSAYWSTE
ncbi:hypothetical protein J6590_028271 [Homalodisca vitripennis]|nr:hypothetical protein J6590_028271 [Homalodisca vitripennis]